MSAEELSQDRNLVAWADRICWAISIAIWIGSAICLFT